MSFNRIVLEQRAQSKSPTILIASDHAGYKLKAHIIRYLRFLGAVPKNYGTDSNGSVDYPDYAKILCKELLAKNFNTFSGFGILICGTGVGMTIASNRFIGIRSALCYTKEIARLSRLHNDANILVLGARFITYSDSEEIVKTFIETEIEGGRHNARIEKIDI